MEIGLYVTENLHCQLYIFPRSNVLRILMTDKNNDLNHCEEIIKWLVLLNEYDKAKFTNHNIESILQEFYVSCVQRSLNCMNQRPYLLYSQIIIRSTT